jgi:hypothetical protein
MKLIEVNDKKLNKEFHKVPFIIYKDDTNWIPNLKQDIDKIFDPSKNKLFELGGAAIRWVLKDDDNNLIGRVATFINPKTINIDPSKMRIGGLGFFECIDDQDAANILFDACKKWLSERDTEGMDGSINFGERNEFWGVLVENFTDPPVYQVNYNLSYYKTLFENYGFKVYFNQVLFFRMTHANLSVLYQRAFNNITRDPKFEIRNIEGIPLETVAEDFRTVYNGAWATHDGFKEMKPAAAQKIMQTLKPIIDPKIIAFVYHDKKRIAFYVNIPELNEIFKYVNGNLNWLGKLKFLYHKWKNPPKTMVGIVFGVVKEFHSKGVDAAMIQWFRNNVVDVAGYDKTVLTWVGDFNPKMISVSKKLGGKEYRKLSTYRYLFNKNAVFERHPVIMVDEKD